MRRLRVFVAIGLVGLLIGGIGLDWDAYIHARNPVLDSNEGLFTLANPSHLLLIAGAILVFVGLVGSAFQILAENERVPAWMQTAFLVVSISFWVVAQGFAVWAEIGDEQHEHAASPVERVDEHSVADEREKVHVGGDGRVVEHGRWAGSGGRDPTEAEVRAAEDLIRDTREGTARFQDIKAAIDDGYVKVTIPKHGIVHLYNENHRNDGRILDTANPEMLVYYGEGVGDGSMRLIGAVYVMPLPGMPGPAVGGPLTVWHSHQGSCAPDDPDPACAPGGVNADTPEMLHVWLIENPGGPFATEMEPESIERILGG